MNIATELDKQILATIAAESIAKLEADANNKRWINAIAKAIVELENNPYCTFNAETHSLLVCSSVSGTTYEANGTCQCKAFSLGQPCWHRAAARLVNLYIAREKTAQAKAAKAIEEIYYQRAEKKRERRGGILI